MIGTGTRHHMPINVRDQFDAEKTRETVYTASVYMTQYLMLWFMTRIQEEEVPDGMRRRFPGSRTILWHDFTSSAKNTSLFPANDHSS